MKYFCNPVNINYRYQFNMDPRQGELQVAREAADPSMIYFKGKYYIFASIIAAFVVYLVATGGWEKVKGIWDRTKYKDSEGE